jgi:hypothetical protein
MSRGYSYMLPDPRAALRVQMEATNWLIDAMTLGHENIVAPGLASLVVMEGVGSVDAVISMQRARTLRGTLVSERSARGPAACV